MFDAFETAPAEWERTTLGTILERGGGDVQTGPFGSQLHASDYKPTGTPSIMPVNIIDGRVSQQGIAYISEADVERLSTHVVRKGDIVYSRRGDVERFALIRDAEDGWLCGTGCLKIRFGRGDLLPEFAAFYLAHPEIRAWIIRHAVGATMPNLNTGIVKAIPFILPPKAQQETIVQTLGTLDDKIEQNRRMARALEEMARATFKAWFVDFEPVKAKIGGQASFPGMSTVAFAALPKSLINSIIGKVPEGWTVQSLKDTVKLTMGQSPSSEFYNLSGKGLPFHQGVSDHAFRFPTRRVYCTVEGRMADTGDVLLSVRAPVGRINVADVRMVLGRGLAGMRHKQDKQSFLLYLMQHHFAEEDAVGDGTIYRSVNKDFVEAMPLIEPPPEILQAFEDVVAPMDALIATLTKESSKLAALRDYLLPRLLDGRLRLHPSRTEVLA